MIRWALVPIASLVVLGCQVAVVDLGSNHPAGAGGAGGAGGQAGQAGGAGVSNGGGPSRNGLNGSAGTAGGSGTAGANGTATTDLLNKGTVSGTYVDGGYDEFASADEYGSSKTWRSVMQASNCFASANA